MNEPTKEEIRAYIDRHLPGATDAGPKEWLFHPTKDGPVRFRGVLLARSGEAIPSEYITRTQFFTVSIYRTVTQQYVLTIEYQSHRRKMDGFFRLFVEPTAEEVRRRINQYDHMECIQGFPKEPEFATRQDRLEHQLGSQFRAAATSALSQAARLDSAFERCV